jgi:hypothetical protein
MFRLGTIEQYIKRMHNSMKLTCRDTGVNQRDDSGCRPDLPLIQCRFDEDSSKCVIGPAPA